MDDFFKDRPVVATNKDTMMVGSGAASSPSGGGAFAPIHHQPAGAPPPDPAGKPGPQSPTQVRTAEKQDLKGEHGTRVQTIVERGRVTRLIVTCTCGKVTEIDCAY